MTWSPETGSGTAYTATAAAAGKRARTFSTTAAARFSPSTRILSSARPAKWNQPSASRKHRSPVQYQPSRVRAATASGLRQ